MPLPPFATRCIATTVLALAGCASVGPDYRAPAVTIADRWQAALPHDGRTSELLDWWRSFDDPTLDQLQQAAVADSPTLARAAARLDAARAGRDGAEAASAPTLKLDASARRSGDKGERVSTQKNLFDASWEIDLFGGLRRGREAASARQEARQADWHDARVSLAAEVGSEYVRYRACQLLETSYRSHLDSLLQTQRTTASAIKAGLNPPADASLADAGVANARVRLIAQQTECELSIKALVALTGMMETTLRDQLAARDASLPQPAALSVRNLPVQWLSQRPDLVAAERAVAAASADIGQAEAQRYPRLSLLGSISLDTSGGATPWSFGPSLSLPLFDGGAARAKVQSRQADYEAAVADYQQAVRSAVKEVEQAMVRLDGAGRREADAAKSAAGYRQHFAAGERLWRAGSSSLFTLEQSRRDALNAEQELIAVRRDRVLYGIALYKALGGGWQAVTSSSQPGTPS